MDTFKAEAIRLALKKMFRPSAYFDICTVRSCLEAGKIAAPKDDMDALAPLHCVHWSEMTPQMREEVFRKVVGLFSLPETDLGDLDMPLIGGDPEKASGLFRRLLGRSSAEA